MRLLPLAYYFENAYLDGREPLEAQPSRCRLCGWIGVHTRAHLRVKHDYDVPAVEVILKLRDKHQLHDMVSPRIEKRRVIR